MSKIYDALQIAHGERFAETKEQDNVSATVSLPSTSNLTHDGLAPTLYQVSELLGLAQSISALLPNPEKNVIQFIGSLEGEGTSTLVRDFAIASAQKSAKPVLLIEADGSNPCQYQAFDVESKPPIDQLLKEGLTLDRVVSEVERANLFLATLSANLQSSLTRRNQFSSPDMWKTIREKFSLILIDSSPVTVAKDSLAISETVDGIVLVVEAEKTRSAVANSVKKQILMRGGNLLGIVFTKQKFYIPKFLYKFL